MKNPILFICLLLLSTGFRSLSEKKKYVNHSEILIGKTTANIIFPKSREQTPPPNITIHNLLKHPPSITKRSFQCKGKGQMQNMMYNCKGIFEHGLPLKDNKEFIQPCLLGILNYIIQKSGENITIIEGHICPQHKKYLQTTKPDLHSKHLIGAAVNFIPENISEKKLKELIKGYYQSNPIYKKLPEFLTFTGNEQAFFNKEISLKMTRNSNGSLSAQLEVLFDKEKNLAIEVNKENIENYLRY